LQRYFRSATFPCEYPVRIDTSIEYLRLVKLFILIACGKYDACNQSRNSPKTAFHIPYNVSRTHNGITMRLSDSFHETDLLHPNNFERSRLPALVRSHLPNVNLLKPLLELCKSVLHPDSCAWTRDRANSIQSHIDSTTRDSIVLWRRRVRHVLRSCQTYNK